MAVIGAGTTADMAPADTVMDTHIPDRVITVPATTLAITVATIPGPRASMQALVQSVLVSALVAPVLEWAAPVLGLDGGEQDSFSSDSTFVG